MEFRVWNASSEEYEDPNYYALAASDGHLIWYSLEGKPEGEVSKLYEDEYKVEYCTGFVDVLGRDIYFGDVLVDLKDHSEWLVSYVFPMAHSSLCGLTSFDHRDLHTLSTNKYEIINNIHDFYTDREAKEKVNTVLLKRLHKLEEEIEQIKKDIKKNGNNY